MKLIDIQAFIIAEFVCYSRFMITSDTNIQRHVNNLKRNSLQQL